VLDFRRETGDVGGQGWALLTQAQIQLDDAANDATLDTYREAIEFDARAGQRSNHLLALEKYSEALQLRGDLDAARDVCKQAQAEAVQLTNPAAVANAELRCALVALDRGDVAAFTAGIKRTQDLAAESGDADAPSSFGLPLARVEIAGMDYRAALKRLPDVVKYFAADGQVATEAEALSLVALCYAALGQDEERDRAATRARELRSAITLRLPGEIIDTELARLLGVSGQHKQAVSHLLSLADDAEKRLWIALALEARLGAVQLLEQIHDPTAADQRNRLETAARAHGFGWVLARLTSKPKG
jgi:tetratricopeptide (TPR) repeat protein